MRAGRGRRAAVAVAAVAALAAVATAAAGLGSGDPAVVVSDQRGRELAAVRLVAVASPSEAVLDYYELDGRRLAEHGWLRLEPARSPPLETLPLVATEVGRRTLVVGGRRLALYELGQVPARLTLRIRR